MNKQEKGKIVQSVPQHGFFGQPKGLFTLFFTEFWERFSYYGMRAILLFYMYTEVVDGGLGISTETATSIMAVYGALVYMTGIIWRLDRRPFTRRPADRFLWWGTDHVWSYCPCLTNGCYWPIFVHAPYYYWYWFIET